MKKFYLTFAQFLWAITFFMFSLSAHSQTKLVPTGSSGSGYTDISNAGFGNENPDCVHGSFGAHVTRAFDSQLNKNVFVFHSHIDADNDRCTNFDRVRMEIKGGGTGTLGHANGETAYYRWKFKLDANFIGSSSFCHIFQIKGYGGSDTGAPLITITPRASTLQVIHDGGDVSGSVDLGVLTSVSLAGFKGEWVEAYVRYKSSDNGLFEITLTRVRDGAVLLSYSKSSGIDMWRAGASRNQGKWGVYRKKVSGLRDEQVRFADFCVSESSASQCPSDIGSSGSIANGTYRIEAQHSNRAMVVQGASTSSGANVFQYSYTSSTPTNDEWVVTNLGNGYYSFINNHSGLGLNVQGASMDNGGNLQQYPYSGGNNSQFKINSVGGGFYEIQARHSSKCVVVEGASTSNSANIIQWTCNGSTNSLWKFTSVSGGARMLPEEAEEVLTPNFMIYPNPSQMNEINISYVLDKDDHVKLSIYDLKGQVITNLLDSHKEKGNHLISWKPSGVPSGVYLARLFTGIDVRTIKFIVQE